MSETKKTRVKRLPKRGAYEQEAIYQILDGSYLCHVAFVHEGYPVSIPTLYGRDGDTLYIHGSAASRMIENLEKGLELCISVAKVNGLVLARSAFHHSINYESVVVFGTATLVEDEEEKSRALKIISEHLIKGRWDETRLPNAKEMKATKVLRIPLEESSAKTRTGPPGDDAEDYKLDIWAGVVPVSSVYGEAVVDPLLKEGVALPESVSTLLKKG